MGGYEFAAAGFITTICAAVWHLASKISRLEVELSTKVSRDEFARLEVLLARIDQRMTDLSERMCKHEEKV